MEYLDELKNLVALHARAQNMSPRRTAATLARITTLEDRSGGWAQVWTAEADALSSAGRRSKAVQHYNLARFPFADTPDRKKASKACSAEFANWAAGVDGAEKLGVSIDGTTVPVWFRGLPTDEPVPLLLVIGGIVSPKEQWADIFTSAAALGMAVVIAEFPGVGENTLRYTGASSALVSAIIDTVAARMTIDGVHALAMSFGGTLVLRAAATDPRLRSIVTVGAPIGYLFDRSVIEGNLPRTTLRTLEHVTGTTGSDLVAVMAECAIDVRELDRITAPVLYVKSRHDEITPSAESDLLRDHVVNSRVVEFDDVHGSPAHMTAVRLRALHALTTQSRRRPALAAALSLALGLGSIFRHLSPIDLGRSAA